MASKYDDVINEVTRGDRTIFKVARYRDGRFYWPPTEAYRRANGPNVQACFGPLDRCPWVYATKARARRAAARLFSTDDLD